MELLVSVIVPIYNVEQYLDRCINSIISQTYCNLEILLIEDGSPDRCPQMCDEWAKKDDRIKAFHKKNGGLSDARNYGLDRATGDFIAFVDSDDYIEKSMYEVMVKAVEKTESNLACCGRYYKSTADEKKSRCRDKQIILSDTEAIHELLNNGCIEEAAWDKLYKKELWNNLRFPLNEINEDIVVMPEIIRRSKRIVHVGLPFYYYCYNCNSITKSGYNSKKDVMFKHMEDLTEYINVYYPSEIEWVGVIKAKYAMTTLFAIVLTGETKKFDSSYKNYRKILKKSYGQMLKSENLTKKQKLEALLLLLGIYKFVWSIKKKIS